MQMETKFLHLRDSVEFGTRFGDWQVCWIGGWARFRLYFLVMLVKIPLPAFPQGCDEATPIGARILVAGRTIDLAFDASRAMNDVAMNTFTMDTNNNITAFASLGMNNMPLFHTIIDPRGQNAVLGRSVRPRPI